MTAHTNYSATYTSTVSRMNVSDHNHTANDSVVLDESCNHFGNWKEPMAWVELCIMPCIIIMNLLGLVSLLRPDQSINPSFKIYIGNLLLANLSFAILENPFDLLYELSCNRWVMGWVVCDLFIYCNYAVTAWAMHAHVLITLNRLWAVVFPYSYRRQHSRTIAVVLCCGAIVYVHVWILPGIIMDSQFYRASAEELNCELNTDAQKSWALAVQSFLFMAPIAFVAVSYLCVVAKLRSQSKVRHAAGTQDMASTMKRNPVVQEKLAHETGQVNYPNSHHRQRNPQQNKQTFFILTSLTVSLIVTWTPYEVNQLLAIVDFSIPAELDESLDLLWTAQAILDPLLSTYLITDLKRICRSFLKK